MNIPHIGKTLTLTLGIDINEQAAQDHLKPFKKLLYFN